MSSTRSTVYSPDPPHQPLGYCELRENAFVALALDSEDPLFTSASRREVYRYLQTRLTAPGRERPQS